MSLGQEYSTPILPTPQPGPMTTPSPRQVPRVPLSLNPPPIHGSLCYPLLASAFFCRSLFPGSKWLPFEKPSLASSIGIFGPFPGEPRAPSSHFCHCMPPVWRESFVIASVPPSRESSLVGAGGGDGRSDALRPAFESWFHHEAVP